jgi:hypothetical protein
MAWGLAQGERRLGLDASVLTAAANWLGYPYDISLHWEKKRAVTIFFSSIKAFLTYRNHFDVETMEFIIGTFLFIQKIKRSFLPSMGAMQGRRRGLWRG